MRMIKESAIIYPNVELADDVKVYHGAVIREGSRVGKGSVIGTACILESNVYIATHTTIHSRVILTDYTEVDDWVFIGPGTVVTNTKYIQHGRTEICITPVKIRSGARIGANCTILPGVTIGEEAVIGAGSVVTKNVPDGEIWYGNPARRRGKVPRDEYHPELKQDG